MSRVDGAPSPGGVEAELQEAPGGALEEFLPPPDAPSITPREGAQPKATVLAAGSMRTARVARLLGRKATLTLRGQPEQVDAVVAPEVDLEVVTDAHTSGDSVLVEFCEGELPLIVAVLQTRRPRELRLKAATIVIEGEKEILLRSGRGAIRIREDGEIEVIGSRISAASRGLFRIVGRILRLN